MRAEAAGAGLSGKRASHARGGPIRMPLARVSEEVHKRTPREHRGPVIVEGAALRWAAVGKWTPAFFRATYPDLEIHGRMSLPADGVPYFNRERSHRRAMKVAEFIELMEAGERCYVDSDELKLFEGLSQDYDFAELVDGPQHSSLWLGARTRSGLHYDVMANYLAQIHGTKNAVVIAPEFARALYPFPDDVTKSQVDPTAPDLAKYPEFARVTLFEGELRPGDVLSIPTGWWHYLHAPDISASINCWYGPPMAVAEHLRRIRAAGISVVLRVARDFVWYGVLGHVPERRLFCPPPVGKIFYEICRAALTGRAYREA